MTASLIIAIVALFLAGVAVGIHIGFRVERKRWVETGWSDGFAATSASRPGERVTAVAELLAPHSGDNLPPVEVMLAQVRRRISELKRREAAPERHLRLVEEVASRG